MFKKIAQWLKRTSGAQSSAVVDELPNVNRQRGHYFEVDVQEIIRLRNRGMGWRGIAKAIGRSRTLVQERYEEAQRTQPVEPIAVSADPPAASVQVIRPEVPASPAAVLPEGFSSAISGLVAPAPRPSAPAPIPEQPIAAEVEQDYPETPYLFVFANESDCVTAVAYGLNSAVWSDTTAPARMRAARRVYLIAQQQARSEILAALSRSPLLAKVRIAFGDLQALCTIARRVFVDGNAQQVEIFERFAGIVAAPEPTPTMLPQTTEPQYGGTPPLEKYPSPAFQRVTRPW